MVSRQKMGLGSGFITLMCAGSHPNKKLVILVMLMQILLLISALLLGAQAAGVQGWETLTDEEHLELERQLQVINKPPIKSFTTEHGDILDCIDINKQHAFDHPLLKDHKVKMRPRRMPKGTSTKSPTSMPNNNIRCPSGSVLIKRTTKEDLIMAKRMKASRPHYPKRAPFSRKGSVQDGFISATAEYSMIYTFGIKSTINVWKPSVSSDQLSLASLWVVDDPFKTVNAVQAGWKVDPTLGKGNYTRLFTYWTSDGYNSTGCYDHLCPGFVQTSPEITPGYLLNHISTYNGPQQDIELTIFKDSDWWLSYYNKLVGYWPKNLFVNMYLGGNATLWGGQVYTPPKKPSPEMGSGHFPKEGHVGKSAYFKNTQIWDGNRFLNPDAKSVKVHSDKPRCYDAQITKEDTAPFGVDLFYGGPGHCRL